MHLDLHLHSICSDGTRSPEAIVEEAGAAGLHAISITDHDTTAGVEPARRAGRHAGVVVISGCELTCSMAGHDLHLLGYGVDPAHRALADFTGRMQAMRRDRIGEIVRRLQALGVTISESDVVLPPGNAAAGRPHVAEALVRLGVVAGIQEAFSRFLSDAGPAAVPARGPDVRDGIEAVHAAGGIAVWAHPGQDDVVHVPALAAAGLDGVEAYRPGAAPVLTQSLEQVARDCDLVVSGGSDWHGGTAVLGAWFVTDRHVPALLDRLGLDRDGKELS